MQDEDVCLYCFNGLWGRNFELPKTLQWSQMENCREYLSLGVRKPIKIF